MIPGKYPPGIKEMFEKNSAFITNMGQIEKIYYYFLKKISALTPSVKALGV